MLTAGAMRNNDFLYITWCPPYCQKQNKHSHDQYILCNKPLSFFRPLLFMNTQGFKGLYFQVDCNYNYQLSSWVFIHQRHVWLQIKQTDQHEIKCYHIELLPFHSKSEKNLVCIFIHS